MIILFAAALLAAVFFVISYPLLWPAHRLSSRNGRDPAFPADLLEQRERIYADLEDLELDRGLGTLGQEDYDDLSRRYRRQAIAVLKALRPAAAIASPLGSKPAPTDDDLAAEIEREIAARRRVAQRQAAAQNSAGASLGRFADPAARRWATGLGLVTVVVLASISYLYLSNRPGIERQHPISTVAAVNAGPMVVVPKNVLLAASDGIHASADGARVWRSLDVSGPVRALAARSGAASQSPTVYVAAGDRLLRSEDGGSTWVTVTTDLPVGRTRALAVTTGAADVLYAVVAPNRLYRSADRGASWTAIGSTLPEDVVDLAVQPSMPHFLFVASPSRGVLRSANDGETWEAASGAANLAIVGQINRLAIAPQTGTIFAGTDQGLFRSETNGTEWIALSYRGDVAAIGVDIQRAGIIYVVDGRGQVFRSTDRGATWDAQE